MIYGLKPKPKRNKYGAKKAKSGDIVFSSKKERRRHTRLLLLVQIGAITNLELQPRFLLMPAFRFMGKAVRKTEYVADFAYDMGGKHIVEDVKGMKTPVYRIKAKLFQHQYAAPNGWEFHET